jgi:hypothetical protein
VGDPMQNTEVIWLTKQFFLYSWTKNKSYHNTKQSLNIPLYEPEKRRKNLFYEYMVLVMLLVLHYGYEFEVQVTLLRAIFKTIGGNSQQKNLNKLKLKLTKKTHKVMLNKLCFFFKTQRCCFIDKKKEACRVELFDSFIKYCQMG